MWGLFVWGVCGGEGALSAVSKDRKVSDVGIYGRNAKFHGSITTSRTDSGESAASSYGSSYHSFTEDCGGVWRTTSKE